MPFSHCASRLGVYFLCWGLLSLFTGTHYFALSANAENPVTFLKALSWAGVDWFAWLALAPAVFPFSDRFRFDGGLRNVMAQLLVAVGFAALHLLLLVIIDHWFRWPWGTSGDFWPSLRQCFQLKYWPDLFTAGAILALNQIIILLIESRWREQRAMAAEQKLTEARLSALQTQLQPHFLFNSLNTIAEMVHEHPKLADQMIARLSELLRATLQAPNDPEVPLQQELNLVRLYLRVEQVRFGERLQVTVTIPHECERALVPALLLQPLVENSIHHGISKTPGAGKIMLRAARRDSELVLEVEDNGAGFTGDAPDGVGLANTRMRLKLRYGADSSLQILKVAGKSVVRLVLPWRGAEAGS